MNYDRSKFRIRNVFFNDTIETELINNHVIFGSIEGGYISFNEQRNFFLSYAEDIEGTITMLCENDTQFFDILLLVAKYSTLTYVGEISDDDEDEKEKYIAMCNDIYFCELNSALFD